MNIHVEKDEDGEILNIFINEESVNSDDNETWYVPRGLLKGIMFDEMPVDVRFEICSDYQEDIMICDLIPFCIVKRSSDTAHVVFEDCGRRKHLDENFEFSLYMETKRDIIKDREKEIGDTKLESYDDDGDHICLYYSTDLKVTSFDELIETAEQIIKEIDGTVDLILGSSIKRIRDTDNEKDFTLSVIIPLLRQLGFKNVRYYHGTREYGRDIVFMRNTEFDDLEYWGMQVKYGDISGGAYSDIDSIIGQTDDAFKMPFYDLYTKSKQKISKFVIVISGKYTDNAIEKICDKIESNAIKNNTYFFDGDKIESLIEKVREKGRGNRKTRGTGT